MTSQAMTSRAHAETWSDGAPPRVTSPSNARASGSRPRRAEDVRYEEGPLLGSGGMGDVHASTDTRIGRVVACKTLRRGRGDVEATARFVDEARLQGRLEHPAIVPVYDLGTLADGTPFFTMKRVRGTTLADALDVRGERTPTRSWSLRQLLGAVSSVALAIEYAHQAGVVHGDLKPANIMLGRFGEVHVLDWGCAAEARTSTEASRVSTEASRADGGHDTATALALETLGSLRAGDTHRIVGTPGYMAPEQARGVRGAPRSDVYALGAILFEVLAGEPLHVGATPLALVVSTLDPLGAKRPSERAPSLSMPEGLDELVARAIDPDPAARPSARTFATGIEKALDADAVRLGTRQSARTHLAQALAAEEEALLGDERARPRALAEAGRALALDPDDETARALMTRLLGQRPATLPPEAHREITRSERDIEACAVRATGDRTLVWALMIPLALALGVHDGVGAALVVGLIVATALAFLVARRRVPLTHGAKLGLVVLAMVTTGAFSALFGPFVLAPVFATTTAVVLSLGFGRALRAPIAVLGLAAILVPFALELAGIVSPSMSIAGDAIVITPRLVGFPPLGTAAFLVAGHLLAVPVSVIVAARLRDTVDAARERLTLRAWQLEQAIPPART
jgi:serine/threonine-protein kinase